MIYKIEFKKQPQKFLKKQQKHIQNRVKNWLKVLISNPYKENNGIVINYFIEGKQVYKKRFGDIRVFFIIYDDLVKILITEAKNRGQAYNKK